MRLVRQSWTLAADRMNRQQQALAVAAAVIAAVAAGLFYAWLFGVLA